MLYSYINDLQKNYLPYVLDFYIVNTVKASIGEGIHTLEELPVGSQLLLEQTIPYSQYG